MHLREKAVRLRTERGLTIDEIAERLLLSRTTVPYWVRELPPLERRGRGHPGQRKGSRAMRRKYAQLREAAYAEGLELYDQLIVDPLFRDFLCLYIAEGYKRSRNAVSVGNSDPRVLLVCHPWMLRFARNPLRYYLQYHADQDLGALREFWSEILAVDPSRILMQRKSNSGQLSGRTWRSAHGVLTIAAGDTYFRARLQAWMDQLGEQWVRFGESGRSSAW